MKSELKQLKNMTLHMSLTPDEWKYVQDMRKAHPNVNHGLCMDIEDDVLNKIRHCDKLSVCIEIKVEE